MAASTSASAPDCLTCRDHPQVTSFHYLLPCPFPRVRSQCRGQRVQYWTVQSRGGGTESFLLISSSHSHYQQWTSLCLWWCDHVCWYMVNSGLGFSNTSQTATTPFDTTLATITTRKKRTKTDALSGRQGLSVSSYWALLLWGKAVKRPWEAG